MGMTIEDCISKLTEILEEATEDENSVCYVTDVDEPTLKTAIDTMRKYQQLQADYENCLKADMVAMLTEIREKAWYHHSRFDDDKDFEVDRAVEDIVNYIDSKINSLKEA